jgi:endonuclease III-like uncharacterized protein
LNESLIIDEKEKNNDRELIEDFLVKVKEVQKAVINMEKKNEEMREIADKQINENKSANQQSRHALIHTHSESRSDQRDHASQRQISEEDQRSA